MEKTHSEMIRNEMTLWTKAPQFSVMAPASLAAANVLNVQVPALGQRSTENCSFRPDDGNARLTTGVMTSLTRLATIAPNAPVGRGRHVNRLRWALQCGTVASRPPMMVPTAKSTTLPRAMKSLNSDASVSAFSMKPSTSTSPWRNGFTMLMTCVLLRTETPMTMCNAQGAEARRRQQRPGSDGTLS